MLPKPRMTVRLFIASYVRSTMGPAPAGRVRVAQSLTLHIGLFHQRDPFRRVGLDEGRELVGRIARRRLVARRHEALAQLGIVEAALQAELSFPMIAGDVPLGATKPFHPITENPASPDCAIAGRPGTSGEAVSDVTPMPRTVPPLICATAVEAIENIISTEPPTTALSAAFASRNGTCTTSMPAMDLNSSPARCGGVPMPDDA